MLTKHQISVQRHLAIRKISEWFRKQGARLHHGTAGRLFRKRALSPTQVYHYPKKTR